MPDLKAVWVWVWVSVSVSVQVSVQVSVSVSVQVCLPACERVGPQVGAALRAAFWLRDCGAPACAALSAAARVTAGRRSMSWPRPSR